jgi:import inner membrane translocase subunit TIM8
MSSWFGGGGSSEPSSSYDSGSDFSSSSSSDFGQDFSSQPLQSYGGGGVGGGGGGEVNQQRIQMEMQREQQKAMLQQAISQLTELCWKKCVTRPDVKLSSSEESCLSQCAERYIDTSMFIMNRMTKQQR